MNTISVSVFITIYMDSASTMELVVNIKVKIPEKDYGGYQAAQYFAVE